jgi:D-threo-aldose 1-dehydrogenase
MMDPTATRTLGKSGVQVTQLGLGTAPFGELFQDVPARQALATVDAAWDAGIRYFDSAPWYGLGMAEHRLGTGLQARPRGELVVSTKVGRWLSPAPDLESRNSQPMWKGGFPFDVNFDYGYDGIMRSVEQSYARLGLSKIDLLIIHDLDFQYHGTEAKVSARMAQLYTSGWRALEELRRSGVIGGVGAGINEGGMIPRFLDTVDVDFFLVALPYTLMDQEVLDRELPACQDRNVGLVIGAVFASGILATGPVPGAKYRYRDASPEEMDKAGRIQKVCEAHGVPIAAAALQFTLGHPSVASVIPGALTPDHVRANAASFRHPIPAGLWSDLKSEGLLRADAPTP